MFCSQCSSNTRQAETLARNDIYLSTLHFPPLALAISTARVRVGVGTAGGIMGRIDAMAMIVVYLAVGCLVAVSASAMTVEDALHEGLLRHRNGDVPGALAVYDAVLRAEPRHGDALHLRGAALMAAGDLEGAVASIARAVQATWPVEARKPATPGDHATVTLAQVLDATRDVSTMPAPTANYFNSLGEALRQQGKLPEAEAALSFALAAAESSPTAIRNMAGVLHEQGRYTEALALHQRLLDKDPGDVGAVNSVGTATNLIAVIAVHTLVTVFRVSCFVCWLPVALHRAMGDHGKALATLNDRLQLGGLNMQQQVRGSPRVVIVTSHPQLWPVSTGLTASGRGA